MHSLYVFFTTLSLFLQVSLLILWKLKNTFILHVAFFILALVLIAKQEFSDPHDADDAQYNLDGREVDGSRIIVEFAKGVSWCPVKIFLFIKLLLKRAYGY
jgi:hypothetical protein